MSKTSRGIWHLSQISPSIGRAVLIAPVIIVIHGRGYVAVEFITMTCHWFPLEVAKCQISKYPTRDVLQRITVDVIFVVILIVVSAFSLQT